MVFDAVTTHLSKPKNETAVTCLNSIAKIVVHCFLSVLISALKLTIHLSMSIKQSILDKGRRGQTKML